MADAEESLQLFTLMNMTHLEKRELRILILEDCLADADLMQFELSEGGFEFEAKVVDRKKDFIEALEEFKPDIVLSDYELPSFTGADALQITKAKTPETPFVLVTGAVGEERAIEILTSGATDYVLKRNLSRLAPAVRRALKEAEEHRKRQDAEKDRDTLFKELEQRVQERTSALQEALAAVQDMEAKLEAALESMQDAVFISDTEGNFIDFNEAFATYHKFASKDECYRKLSDYQAFFDVFFDDGALAPLDMWPVPRSLRGETVKDTHYILRRKDTGERWWGSYSFAPIRNNAGEIVGSVVVGRDITESKEAQEALKAQEEKLQVALTAGGMGTWVLDPAKVVVKTDRLHRLNWDIDYDGDEVPLDVMISRLHPDDRKLLDRPEGFGEIHGAFDLEFRIIHRNGDVRWLRASASPRFGPDGALKEIVGVNFDITHQKRTEEELRASERRLRTFFESDMVGTIYWTVDGKITDANDAFLRMVGNAREELSAGLLTWYNLTPAEYADKDKLALQDLMTKGVDTPYEKEFLRKDGSRVPVIIGAAMLDENRYEGVAFVLDITERKRIERELRQKEERYRLIFESSLSGVLFTKPDGSIISANKTAQKLLGMTEEEIAAAGRNGILDTADPRLSAGLEKRIRSGSFFGELNFRRKGGTLFPAEVASTIFKNAKGETYASVIFRDIGPRKQAEEKLKERTRQLEMANKELESFSYSVSHDLRAPLRAIDGYSRMLSRQEDKLDDEAKRRLNEIRFNVLKMDRLINDLLHFARSGSVPISVGKIDMNRVLGEVIKVHLTVDGGYRAKVIVRDLPPALGDESLIRQVLSNLVENAVKYSREKAQPLLEIEGTKNGKETIYCVRDNGLGFDMKYYHKLFGVFQRLHTSDKIEGTGIGLAIVQRIVYRHGGRVWAEGKEGEGAAFYFSLPAA